jgi:amidase
MTIHRPTVDELHALAHRNHFSISDAQMPSFQAVFERILPHYDALDAMPLPLASAPVHRDPGRRVEPDENFCNAFVRRCLVQGAAQGPLRGKRVGIKDSVSIAGVPITCGSRVIEFMPRDDATVVRRILGAGGDIVAILNMDNLAFSGAGDTSAYGPTTNPHDLTRLAGGSSGGSAAALLSGQIDLSLGCDQAGSIRIPAAWCGVVGLKPTFSLVPYTGILGFDMSFDHVGPMGRTVADVALLLDVIAGADGLDPRQRDVSQQSYVGALNMRDLAGIRIGVLQEGFGTPGYEADVEDAVMAAVDRMASLGAEVSSVRCQAHLAAGPIVWGVFAEGVAATFQSNGQGHHWTGPYDPDLSIAFGSGMRTRGNDMPLQCKFNLMLGTLMNDSHHGRFYAKAQTLRAGLRSAYDELFSSFDVLVMPTTPMRAHKYNPDQTPEEFVLAGWDMVANTAPFNMTGHPALSVPCGRPDGLPVGMMLVGRHFGDGTLLAVAERLERSLD